MPDKPLCFVDIETTGINAVNGKIIEIGILKVENNKLINSFETLINPELRIDPFIEQMTGIKYESLTNAPIFSDIKDELLEILDNSIFVAHNVRFDYGFIRNEFKRLGINFKSRHFCTVKLARALYPNLGHYNLDSIMQNFNIKNKNRHRAYGDAAVLWEFYKKSQKINEKEKFENALKLVMKKPTLPSSISEEQIENLPEGPGVYVFFGDTGIPIYIGKSINIKDRVLSHFSNDYLSGTDMKISQQIKSIETFETAGELSALLLESSLIKKHQPLFNRMLREARKMSVLLKKVNKQSLSLRDKYNTIEIKTLDEIEVDEIQNILGVFRSIKQLKDFVYEVCNENKLCPKLMGFDKSKKSCFNYQLGKCSGACQNKELFLKYNLRFDQAFFNKKVKSWNFDGPIFIKENNDKEEVHLIDKWCYLGSLKNENDEIGDIKKEYRFDYDTYKILRRYISNPNNQKNITVVLNHQ
jgi:DNA polymerase III subunit epsilon